MRSLRLKLILGFLLVLGAVILSFSLFVYFAKRNALLSVLDSRLTNGMEALATHVELDEGRLIFRPAVDYDIRGVLPQAYRIVDAQGQVVAQSAPDFPLTWPTACSADGRPSWTTSPAEKDGSWRLAAVSSRVGDEKVGNDEQVGDDEMGEATVPLSSVVTIQCGAPMAPVKRELEDLASQLTFLALAAFLVAGAGSFFLAGWTLRPVRRINAALAEVSEASLDRRIDPGPFDRELHPLIAQLNAALDRLDRAFRCERQFTADVSHEMRTPVAGILSTIEVLLRKPRTGAELREAHAENLQIALRMESMIERLLLLARMDAGKGSPARRPTAIAPLVEEVLASAGPEARKRGLRLEHDVDPALEADVDPGQMKIALGNLVDNAVCYNNPDGSVRVRARRTPEGLTIEVEDSGIGIPADQLSLVFDRFHRIDASRAEVTDGYGLGLSIVQKIVEAHGGRIQAASGRSGSLFTIVLPGA
ncbi:HAMP domain-containing protein [bacterium]|nr:MAG: HAMP domain-containing protein [bacterium]